MSLETALPEQNMQNDPLARAYDAIVVGSGAGGGGGGVGFCSGGRVVTGRGFGTGLRSSDAPFT